MKLKIKNCAKIAQAEFLFDGLTVIAGNNNTGKSTVGKVLYAFFRSLSNIDRRVDEARYFSIRKHAKELILGYRFLEENENVDIMADLMDGKDLESIVTYYVNAYLVRGEKAGFLRLPKEEVERTIKESCNLLKREITTIREMTNAQFQANIVQKVFDCVFHKQYRPLRDLNLNPELILDIKGEENIIRFTEMGCDVINPTKISKKVRYISTPDVLSLINKKGLDRIDQEVADQIFDKYVLELVRELKADGQTLSPAEQIEVETSFKDFNQAFNQVIKGEFKRDTSAPDAPFCLFEEGMQEATKAENLSMGLKFFVLLRHMLKKGILKEKDILILDEPENHLHPEWQVLYARILVLLQKKYNLTILVTSHSTFFVNALQRFSILEEITDKTRFYLAKVDDSQEGASLFVANDIYASDIFKSFNKGFQLIDQMSGDDEDA